MGGMQPHFWDEDTGSRYGPGISRPLDKERTRQFTLKVTIQTLRPMKWTTQAATADKAKQYALARWPGATVEVIE
jgi:hypothetical protein